MTEQQFGAKLSIRKVVVQKVAQHGRSVKHDDPPTDDTCPMATFLADKP